MVTLKLLVLMMKILSMVTNLLMVTIWRQMMNAKWKRTSKPMTMTLSNLLIIRPALGKGGGGVSEVSWGKGGGCLKFLGEKGSVVSGMSLEVLEMIQWGGDSSKTEVDMTDEELVKRLPHFRGMDSTVFEGYQEEATRKQSISVFKRFQTFEGYAPAQTHSLWLSNFIDLQPITALISFLLIDCCLLNVHVANISCIIGTVRTNKTI